MILRYLTHPQVQIDPAVPVPRWGLTEIGRQRVQALAGHPLLADTQTIVSSGEVKAMETARPLADALGLEFEVRERMHENDRSATGFLVPDEFEKVADQFFARPEESVRGWERAADAQARIVAELQAALAHAVSGDILFIGHGGVGTLLLCHLAGWPIDRRHDQPAGGGNLFAFDLTQGRLLHGWVAIENLGQELRDEHAE